jgi:predicted MPP superfamily phosphohydrolase
MIDINKITWLHISDLHMRPSNVVDSDIVLEKLLEDVEKCIQKDSLQPGFIILTGDISYSGKPEEYEVAQKFLDKLLKISDLGKDRIFIVPGNHDVDRGMITTAARIIADSINNRDSINGILASDVDRAFILQRFHNYKKFIDEYCGKDVLLFNNEHYYYAKNIPIANLNLSILGLNSALLAGSDKDQEKLVLGDTQVRKALAEVENADICIAIMHHPFDWLQKFG